MLIKPNRNSSSAAQQNVNFNQQPKIYLTLRQNDSNKQLLSNVENEQTEKKTTEKKSNIEASASTPRLSYPSLSSSSLPGPSTATNNTSSKSTHSKSRRVQHQTPYMVQASQYQPQPQLYSQAANQQQLLAQHLASQLDPRQIGSLSMDPRRLQMQQIDPNQVNQSLLDVERRILLSNDLQHDRHAQQRLLSQLRMGSQHIQALHQGMSSRHQIDPLQMIQHPPKLSSQPSVSQPNISQPNFSQSIPTPTQNSGGDLLHSAMAYINEVKTRFAKEPQVFARFQQILKAFKSRQ